MAIVDIEHVLDPVCGRTLASFSPTQRTEGFDISGGGLNVTAGIIHGISKAQADIIGDTVHISCAFVKCREICGIDEITLSGTAGKLAEQGHEVEETCRTPAQELKGDLNIVLQCLELLGVTANSVVPIDQSWAQVL